MTYEAELRRRKFMQVYGRHLGWGLVGLDKLPGVRFTDSCWVTSFYRQFDCWELYSDHEGDREAAERAVIDKAISEHERHEREAVESEVGR